MTEPEGGLGDHRNPGFLISPQYLENEMPTKMLVAYLGRSLPQKPPMDLPPGCAGSGTLSL